MSERKGTKGSAAASAGQSHLPPAPPPAQDESARIDKLVSLTYDSNPDVRRRAAQELAGLDDPRAVFALLELGADKDPGVQEMARAALDSFKGEEREALVSLEKIFEARQEGKPPPADMAEARQKLLPSLERLFSKNKAARDRLLPSIEKLFSWMPGAPGGAAPSQTPASRPAEAGHSTSRPSFEQVATAHLSDEEKATARAQQAESARAAQAEEAARMQAEGEDAGDDDSSDAVPASVPIPARDPMAGMEAIRAARSSMLEQAEADVGVPAHLRSPEELRRMRGAHAGYSGQAEAGSSRQPSLSSSSPSMQSRMEEATNFPIPEYLQPKAPSPTAAIPSMLAEEPAEPQSMDEEGVKMPRHALYYYKLAYAIALTPGIKASEIKKEKERLMKEAKSDIELAFEIAVKRTHQEGIENLSGLKPGLKKLSTLPLEVLDNMVVSVPHGKKLLAYNRLLLSDGKHQLPLYVQPPRADGIKPGDLLSLRDAMVDYWVKSNPVPGGQPGELVLLLGKNAQLIVTK